ncbi:magnesium transporter NIPA-domain-containing protein, partial [Zopfochytrium polystomum]
MLGLVAAVVVLLLQQQTTAVAAAAVPAPSSPPAPPLPFLTPSFQQQQQQDQEALRPIAAASSAALINHSGATLALAWATAAIAPSERTIGVLLAVLSSVLIGISYVITKTALIDTSRRSGQTPGEHVLYLRSGLWWVGMSSMTLGEIANFAAYSYAPALLVTPLGAGSVLVSAFLAHVFLGERLQRPGVLGCILGLIGSVLIIINSPEERPVQSVDDILGYTLQPLFMTYLIGVAVVSVYLIYVVAPVHGRSNMLVYIAICSLVGSVSVMACKGFAIALKLTFSGANQLTRPITYVFGITVIGCAITQMKFLNKALELFSTNLVTPIYYAFFTSATIIASVILFQGFNDADPNQVVSVLCGFAIVFVGIYLLN